MVSPQGLLLGADEVPERDFQVLLNRIREIADSVGSPGDPMSMREMMSLVEESLIVTAAMEKNESHAEATAAWGQIVLDLSEMTKLCAGLELLQAIPRGRWRIEGSCVSHIREIQKSPQ